MEARNITIINGITNSTSVISSKAETLKELKEDLILNNIQFSSSTIFKEGLTKATFQLDESVLPKDVNYKGDITNNLVFMLTTESKKIRSGARSRSDIFMDIKILNLASEIKRVFQKCYPLVSSEDLEKLISKHKELHTQTKELKEDIKYKDLQNKKSIQTVEDVIDLFIETLKNTSNYLLVKNRNFKTLKVNIIKFLVSERSYDSSELDEMFENM